ncbi:MAG TPA: DNA polymerase IV [Candidatus Kerfeldbacteria bacterium]|nr:DNA polymerase IV [Candidatus Kerfeldbacteria bacterium]
MQRVIAHIDGDAFFAACEQAVHPEYRGQPVITGQERGIVAAASYEAKRYGVQRGVPLWEVKKLCPHAIIVPSDYETYSLFSQRMFECMRRVSPIVEEYGIDEGFVDITGLRGPTHRSYSQLAWQMKQTIQQELGISVSVGLSVSKVLAKLGSKWKKPNGFTVILPQHISTYTTATPTEKVWGIGHNTAAYLAKFGIHTAADFAKQSEQWVHRHTHKPFQELWQELNGQSVWEVHTAAKTSYQSISKMKTFTPPSSNRSYVFAQLSKNIENAFIKARRYDLSTKKIVVYLKQHNFRYRSLELVFNRLTSFPQDVLTTVEHQFHRLFQPTILYRATGVILVDLCPMQQVQLNLFESPIKLEKLEQIYASIDALAKRYGKHTVMHGSSLPVVQAPDQRITERQRAMMNNQLHQTIYQRKFLGMPIFTPIRP